MSLIVIDDKNYHLHTVPGGYGLTPRDYAAAPFGSLPYAKPLSLPLVEESDIPDMIAAKKAAGSNLSDIRMRGDNGQMIPSRNQGQFPFCWAHGPTSAMLLVRARDNQPFADLSAFGVACPVANYRRRGGQGIEAVQYIAKTGVPTSRTWPQQSTDRSLAGSPTVLADAALHRADEWEDLDPDQMELYVATCLLNNIPIAVGLNWWSHEVCYMDLLGWNPLWIKGWNSWGDEYSDHGMFELKGRKAIPSDAVAIRTSYASAA